MSATLQTLTPVSELRAARSALLAALQGHPVSDLLIPGAEGAWCGRDVLLHIAVWLRELSSLVPDLAMYGYQRGESFDPGPDWTHWNELQIEPYRAIRPEAAVAAVVTTHARLLDVVGRLDEAGLHRHGLTRFGFTASGWELLLAEAAHEREHTERLVPRHHIAIVSDTTRHRPGPMLRAS